MAMTQSAPDTSFLPPKPAGRGWIWQSATGLGLILLAGLHMIAHHFVAEGGLRDFGQVQAYLRSPLIWPLEVLFLVCVTAHALLGVRAVIFDLGLNDAQEQRVTRILWGLGLAVVGYGLWLTWTVIHYPA